LTGKWEYYQRKPGSFEATETLSSYSMTTNFK